MADYFNKHGITLVQGYGLTESSPVDQHRHAHEHRLGTVGKPIAGVEVKIADDGEILTRGPHVMAGYWKLPKDTAEAIQDGWLHTGDLGCIEDGYLRITGRKKELIVTAGGKNIAPSYLEGLLTQDPLIAQAVVIGDAKNYLTALIVPNPDALRAEIMRRQIPVFSPAEALAHPQCPRAVRRGDQAATGRRFARRAGAEVHLGPPRVHDGNRRNDAHAEGASQRRDQEFRRRNRQDVRERGQGSPAGRRVTEFGEMQQFFRSNNLPTIRSVEYN